MRCEILYQPAFACARTTLEQGESIRADGGAMVSMSSTITLDSKMEGGFGKALGRMFAGETFFQTTLTATHGPGEVILAPSVFGDIIQITLQGNGFFVTSGGYLASDPSLDMSTKGSLKAFGAGEGLFLTHLKGQGDILVASLGAIHAVELGPGQPYIIDTGHVVAFNDFMQYDVKTVTRGMLKSLRSGEGYVCEFVGPGTVYLQTRSPQQFAAWLAPLLPSRS